MADYRGHSIIVIVAAGNLLAVRYSKRVNTDVVLALASQWLYSYNHVRRLRLEKLLYHILARDF